MLYSLPANSPQSRRAARAVPNGCTYQAECALVAREDTHEAPRVALLVASSFLPFPGAPRCSSPPGRGDGPRYFLNPAAEPPARSLYASIKL